MCKSIFISGASKASRRRKTIVGGLLACFFAFEAHAGIMVDRSVASAPIYDDSIFDVSFETTDSATSSVETALKCAALGGVETSQCGLTGVGPAVSRDKPARRFLPRGPGDVTGK